MALNTIDELIEDIRQGKMVILMDDEDRENEGDLIMAAECVRTEDINFMVKHARGLVCMPMTRERCERLGLPLMVQRNGSGFGTKFTVSIEAAEGVTTGISAADRARTVQAAAAKNAVAADIVSPGHIFPLMAQPGGTLARAGHTEAACDLARMAGFEPSGVICEVMNDDGSMARRPELEAFAAEHGIKIGTIADLIHYRLIHERTVERIAEQPLDSELGHFNLITYRDSVEGDVHLALTLGKVCAEEPTPGAQGHHHLQHRRCRFADPARPRRAQDAPAECADALQCDIRFRPGSCRIPARRIRPVPPAACKIAVGAMLDGPFDPFRSGRNGVPAL